MSDFDARSVVFHHGTKTQSRLESNWRRFCRAPELPAAGHRPARHRAITTKPLAIAASGRQRIQPHLVPTAGSTGSQRYRSLHSCDHGSLSDPCECPICVYDWSVLTLRSGSSLTIQHFAGAPFVWNEPPDTSGTDPSLERHPRFALAPAPSGGYRPAGCRAIARGNSL